MPSFDCISKIDIVALRHAVDNAAKELNSRFDFKGVNSSICLEDLLVTLKSESEFQVKQLKDLFFNHCSKRNLPIIGTKVDEKPLHSGKSYSLTVLFKQGIEQDDARKIIKLIKDAKLKVQASIIGDKIRISGKKKDELQDTIALIKNSDINLNLQFENFRD